jgi:hypothetical protein
MNTTNITSLRKYKGKFYKYNTNLIEGRHLFHLRNITDEEDNIVKEELLLQAGYYKDCTGEFSPNHLIEFTTPIELETFNDEVLKEFEIKEL